jgi:cysteine synthase A
LGVGAGYRDDTVAEGVGLNRMTANFSHAKIDASFQVTDQEMVDMSRYKMFDILLRV